MNAQPGVIAWVIAWGPLVAFLAVLLAVSYVLGRRTAQGVRFTFSAPDPRGWVGIACFSLVLIVLGMMWADRTLLRDDFFKVIATAIILSAWNQGPVGWAFQATKSGGDLADRNATMVERAADHGLDEQAGPRKVQIDQRGGPPVPVDDVTHDGDRT